MEHELEQDWKQRAIAAEKTVEVLKRRLAAIDSGAERSVIRSQLESMQRRAMGIERRRALSELRSAELQKYSESLESEVAARTRQIRTIMDHVTTGFLLVGKSGRVEPGWSKSCAALLTTSELTDRPLAECLGYDGAATRELEGGLEQVFDDFLPEELLLAQLPNRVTIGKRVVALSYSVVRDGGAVVSILLTLTDISSQIEAEAAARRAQALVSILSQLTTFRLYVSDVNHLLVEAEDGIRVGDLDLVRRSIHTVKGNSSVYGLEEVVSVCHEVESSETIVRDHLARIERTLHAFIDDHRALFGSAFGEGASEEEVVRLSRKSFQQLVDLARVDAGTARRYLSESRRIPAAQLAAPLEAVVERLASRLGKAVDVAVVGGDVMVDPEGIAPVLRCLPHLVRNAVDHGLESPEERGEKPPRGTLTLSFEEDGDSLRIAIADDGRGIDTRSVSAIAKDRGLIEDGKELVFEEAVALVVRGGVSTANQVTDISGRGVGLSATREALESVHGKLSVESELGKGTTIRLICPIVVPDAA